MVLQALAQLWAVLFFENVRFLLQIQQIVALDSHVRYTHNNT